MITSRQTVARYTVTAGALAFDVPFPLYEAGDVLVVWARDGAEHELTLSRDYEVQVRDGGGTVTLAPGRAPVGATLALVSHVPETQELDLSHTAEVDTESLERQLDRQVRMIQQHSDELSRCVKLTVTDERTPEEVADELFEARDRAEAAAADAATSRDHASRDAETARAEAERAKTEADRAAQVATLGVGAANLEAVWTLESDLAAGGTLDLPVTYFPGRNMLHLGCDGVELYRGPQYAEIGEAGKDVRSSSVRMLIPLAAGTVLRAWVVASNVARHVEEARDAAEAAANQAKAEADRAQGAVREATEDAVALAAARAEQARTEAGRATEAADTAEQRVAKAVAVATRETAAHAADAAASEIRARTEAGRAETEADRARDEAERAAGIAKLGASVNLEATWTLPAEIPAGGLLTLPDGLVYWLGRSMLRLSHDGVAMYPGAQFAEVDEGRETSGTVRVFLRLKAGAVVNAWIVASNVAKASEEAIQAARDAAVAREVAQNAAREATEQAERSDEAAVDAGRYRDESRAAAKCARAAVQGRSLATVQSVDVMDKMPSGFMILDPDLVLPATIQHPLTPVGGLDDIPNADGFYLVVPPFADCPSEPDEPDAPDRPDGNHDWTLPCGKRARP